MWKRSRGTHDTFMAFGDGARRCQRCVACRRKRRRAHAGALCWHVALYLDSSHRRCPRRFFGRALVGRSAGRKIGSSGPQVDRGGDADRRDLDGWCGSETGPLASMADLAQVASWAWPRPPPTSPNTLKSHIHYRSMYRPALTHVIDQAERRKPLPSGLPT